MKDKIAYAVVDKDGKGKIERGGWSNCLLLFASKQAAKDEAQLGEKVVKVRISEA